MTLFAGSFDQSASSALTVATRDGNFTSPNPPRAVTCNPHLANYTVGVWHNTSSTIKVLSVSEGDRIDPMNDDSTSIQLVGMIEAVGRALSGEVVFQSEFETLEPTLPIAYSPLLRWIRNDQNQSVFEWPIPMEEALPQFMQDVSLSLLSGRFLPQNGTYFTAEWGRCLTTQLIYEYSAWRLLSIYGAGWGVSALCLGVGFFYVGRNGRERDMEFSHLVTGLNVVHSHSGAQKTGA